MFTPKNLKYTKYTNLEFKVVTKLSISTFLLFRRENVSNNPKWFNIVQDNLRKQNIVGLSIHFRGKFTIYTFIYSMENIV